MDELGEIRDQLEDMLHFASAIEAGNNAQGNGVDTQEDTLTDESERQDLSISEEEADESSEIRSLNEERLESLDRNAVELCSRVSNLAAKLATNGTARNTEQTDKQFTEEAETTNEGSTTEETDESKSDKADESEHVVTIHAQDAGEGYQAPVMHSPLNVQRLFENRAIKFNLVDAAAREESKSDWQLEPLHHELTVEESTESEDIEHSQPNSSSESKKDESNEKNLGTIATAQAMPNLLKSLKQMVKQGDASESEVSSEAILDEVNEVSEGVDGDEGEGFNSETQEQDQEGSLATPDLLGSSEDNTNASPSNEDGTNWGVWGQALEREQEVTRRQRNRQREREDRERKIIERQERSRARGKASLFGGEQQNTNNSQHMMAQHIALEKVREDTARLVELSQKREEVIRSAEIRKLEAEHKLELEKAESRRQHQQERVNYVQRELEAAKVSENPFLSIIKNLSALLFPTVLSRHSTHTRERSGRLRWKSCGYKLC